MNLRKIKLSNEELWINSSWLIRQRMMEWLYSFKTLLSYESLTLNKYGLSSLINYKQERLCPCPTMGKLWNQIILFYLNTIIIQ